MVVFDFDGVLRDLCIAVFGLYPPQWDYSINGKNLVDIVNENLDLLLDAPPTNYFDIITELPYIKIYSGQQPDWEPLALEWLSIRMPSKQVEFINTGPNINDKLSFLQEDEYLVDDYPYFESYDKILLVDYPYNKETLCKHRIRSGKALIKYLEKFY